MKLSHVLVGVMLIFIVAGCGLAEYRELHGPSYLKNDLSKFESFHIQQEMRKIPVKTINKQRAFLVADFIESVNGQYEFSKLHRSLMMEIDELTYKFVYGVPVIEENGLYLPVDSIQLIIHEEEVYLPIRFLQQILNLEVRVSDGQGIFQWNKSALASSKSKQKQFQHGWTVDQMIDYLSFLKTPIEGAKVSTIPNHLPGAKRPYRNGYHEGIDWYAYASGQHISTTTPVYAMAEGIVVRVDHDYVEYTSQSQRNEDLALTSKFGETPEYIFDRLRGRQVWVQYENGVMNRFAHLDSIPPGLNVGDKVDEETVIGFVGNSGTSGAVKNDGTQLHLHQDILIYGEQFWKPFSLDEVKEIVVAIFGDS